MASIDETIIRDSGLPKSWTCPHCGKRNRMGKYKEEEFIEFGKTMQHCDRCSYVHLWKLVLTDEFKKQVVSMLSRNSRHDEKHNGKTNNRQRILCAHERGTRN